MTLLWSPSISPVSIGVKWIQAQFILLLSNTETIGSQDGSCDVSLQFEPSDISHCSCFQQQEVWVALEQAFFGHLTETGMRLNLLHRSYQVLGVQSCFNMFVLRVYLTLLYFKHSIYTINYQLSLHPVRSSLKYSISMSGKNDCLISRFRAILCRCKEYSRPNVFFFSDWTESKNLRLLPMVLPFLQ